MTQVCWACNGSGEAYNEGFDCPICHGDGEIEAPDYTTLEEFIVEENHA